MDSRHPLPPLKGEYKMKFDRRHIMLKAWSLFHKFAELGFAECLHRAWLSSKAKEENKKRVEDAKAAAGITEETDTWSGWKSKGFEVIHGSKALFGASLIWGARGDGAEYNARFFGASQVQQVAI